MDEPGFREFLKRAGKKEHVVDGLVAQARSFEVWLACSHHARLEAACSENIKEYAETLPASDIKKQMRALALYYRFIGDMTLAKIAAGLREQQIAKRRAVFKLRDFRGVNLKDIRRLEACGIVTVEDMLAAGKTPGMRRRLTERTGISFTTVLELVKLSDLSRLGAVKSVRARLYYEAGLDTPHEFGDWEPERLREMLIAFVERTHFDGIAPLSKELANAIARARELPKVVQY